MKHWQETLDIARRIGESDTGLELAVATVVHIEGSAYRRPGAKLLITSGGTMHGGVSGGCLEADVQEVARDAIQRRRACTRQYRTGADEDTLWGLGLGCEGTVEVFVQPVQSEAIDIWRTVARLLEGERPVGIGLVLDGPAMGRLVVVAGSDLVAGGTGHAALDRALTAQAVSLIKSRTSGIVDGEGSRVFIEVSEPPPWLIVFGAGDDAVPLVRLAAEVGFRVTVVDHRPAYVTPERFPHAHRCLVRRADEGVDGLPLHAGASAVVMTHTLAHDQAWVHTLVDTPVAYIGVLGPRTRVRRVLESTGGARDRRVFGPVGLDIGADGPEQIAVSVVAEVLAVRDNRSAQHLREREEPIHA